MKSSRDKNERHTPYLLSVATSGEKILLCVAGFGLLIGKELEWKDEEMKEVHRPPLSTGGIVLLHS